MAETIGYEAIARMLRGAAASVRANHELLSKLDTFGGDGDHGTTMVRAMACMEKALDEAASRSLKDMLEGVGWAIMGVDGGATGPLLGTFFMSMASGAVEHEALDAKDLAAMFEAGLAGVRRQTKAQIGDKTLIDALVPAVEALRQAADGGASPVTALQKSAAAAARGAESTAPLQAKFGRARNVKEKSVGHPDPGAASLALIIGGFAEGLQKS